MKERKVEYFIEVSPNDGIHSPYIKPVSPFKGFHVESKNGKTIPLKVYALWLKEQGASVSFHKREWSMISDQAEQL